MPTNPSRTVDAAVIETLPSTAHAWPPEFLTGLYRGANGFVLLPNLTQIFSTLATRPQAATL